MEPTAKETDLTPSVPDDQVPHLLDLVRQHAEQMASSAKPKPTDHALTLEKSTGTLAVFAAQAVFLTALSQLVDFSPSPYISFLLKGDGVSRLPHQRLVFVFLNGISQPSAILRARQAVTIGNVPYTGPALIRPDDATALLSENGKPVEVPDGFFNRLDDYLSKAQLAPSAVLAELEILAEAAFDLNRTLIERLHRALKLCMDNGSMQWDASVFSDPEPSRPTEQEGSQLEWKAAFEWDFNRKVKSAEVRLHTLKTVAAFLNTDGGVLVLGMDDHGKPVGLEGDLTATGKADPAKARDALELRIRQALQEAIDPSPVGHIDIAYHHHQGQTTARLTVRPAINVVSYLVYNDPKSGRRREDVVVRDGNRSVVLSGRLRDQFVLARHQATRNQDK